MAVGHVAVGIEIAAYRRVEEGSYVQAALDPACVHKHPDRLRLLQKSVLAWKPLLRCSQALRVTLRLRFSSSPSTQQGY